MMPGRPHRARVARPEMSGPLSGPLPGPRSAPLPGPVPGPLPDTLCCASILAGGEARRMGGRAKVLLALGRYPLLHYIVQRARPQISQIMLNINDTVQNYEKFGLSIVSDSYGTEDAGNTTPATGQQAGDARHRDGPLAGILASLRRAGELPSKPRYLLTLAGDTPFFPCTLAPCLYKAVEANGWRIAFAASRGRVHPVFALWDVMLADDLAAYLHAGRSRKVLDFAQRHPHGMAGFEDNDDFDGVLKDPFFNINTPDDLAAARAAIALI